MTIIQPTSKRIGRFLEVPNLIELQLNSYRWFLEEGLPELFQTFSPIWDFTQSNFIELVSFSLGEPKYSVDECRDRDMTFEAPIKAIVRFGGREREMIESEVYLGDLPLMTDRGTFIINGRERVIVSQLSRSPGLYFEEGVDTAMQMVISARVIPNEGPWLEIESDSNHIVRTQISQTKKLPLTQLIKALGAFDKGTSTVHLPLKEAIHRKLVEPLADPETGEVLISADEWITQEAVDALPAGIQEQSVNVHTPVDTTDDLIRVFGRYETLASPTADDLTGRRVSEDVLDADGKVVIKAMQRIEPETAKKIESLGLESLRTYTLPSVVEATLKEDPTSNWREAILDIYKRLRPGEAANEDAAKQLIYGLFFDVKRYDLGKVGRRFLNNRLGFDVPIDRRCLTAVDLVGIMFKLQDYIDRKEIGRAHV